MYLYSEVAIRSILEFNPAAKMLAFVRSYDCFVVSYHSQLYLMHEEECEDVESTWEMQQEQKAGDGIPRTCREPSFLQYQSVASFGQQLTRLVDVVPRGSLKIMFFDDWVRDPRKAYREVLRFLDLEDDGFNDFDVVNRARQSRLRSISRVLDRPPQAVLAVARLAKSILGCKRLYLARKLRKLNQVERRDYAGKASDEFRRRITQCMSEDEVLLEEAARYFQFS